MYTFASRSLQDVHMRACMCSLFHLALGNEDGGVKLVYKSTCCLAWGVIFDGRKERGVVCVFSIFKAGGSVCGCMCGYTRAHTLHRWGIRCEPRGRDETPRGPEEYRWTKSRHTYIRICVQSTHVTCSICVQSTHKAVRDFGLSSVLAEFLPSFPSQIWVGDVNFVTFFGDKKCEASLVSHFSEESDALAHEIFF